MLIPYNIPGGPLNLFTIGVTDTLTDQNITHLHGYSINVVVDIRGSWDNKRQFSNGSYSPAARIRQSGIAYVYLGHLFYWKCDECEDCRVRCDDQLSDITRLFDELLSLIRKHRIAILGSREDIDQCRRLQTVTDLLPRIFKEHEMEKRPLKIWHIRSNGLLEDVSRMLSDSEPVDL